LSCRWFSPGTPVSSTNKTNQHVIAEILLRVVLNTITLTLKMTRVTRYNVYCQNKKSIAQLHATCPFILIVGFEYARYWWSYCDCVIKIINVREYRRGNTNGQSRETGNTGHTRRRKTKQKHNTICTIRKQTQTR
jgi:hypothetical protein